MAFMRRLPLRDIQGRCKNKHPRACLLVMLVSLHTLMLAPKHVMMFLAPKTTNMQRIGVNHQKSYLSVVNSIQMLQNSRNRHYPMLSLLRMSSSSTSSEDNDKNNIATTTAETNEKTSAELEAVQAAREARK